METATDAQLAQRIAAGPAGATADAEAELYRRFVPRIRLFGRRHLVSEAACEDLAQEVMLMTITRLQAGEVRDPEQIGSFIFGACRLMAQSERRTLRRREALVATYFDKDVAAQPHVALDVTRVTNCLDKLTERDRLVVLLTYYADCEAPRIAAEVGATPGAVRVIRHRALEHLRDCVGGGHAG